MCPAKAQSNRGSVCVVNLSLVMCSTRNGRNRTRGLGRTASKLNLIWACPVMKSPAQNKLLVSRSAYTSHKFGRCRWNYHIWRKEHSLIERSCGICTWFGFQSKIDADIKYNPQQISGMISLDKLHHLNRFPQNQLTIIHHPYISTTASHRASRQGLIQVGPFPEGSSSWLVTLKHWLIDACPTTNQKLAVHSFQLSHVTSNHDLPPARHSALHWAAGSSSEMALGSAPTPCGPEWYRGKSEDSVGLG